MKNKFAPEFHRIPHFNKEISQMTHDDICPDFGIPLPLDCFFQEKIDGANMGVSFSDGPILRNREHILKKGYSKIKTNAKKQFTSAWNWLHEHEKDIKFIEKSWQSPITIFGEWMIYQHSINYDRLPDTFIAYDIWSVEDNKYLAPHIVEELLVQTNICFIKPHKVILNSVKEIIEYSELESEYRKGVREGIVIKTFNDDFLQDSYKVVNKFFKRRDDFNESPAIKNKIIL
jgi:hypothetical protein